MSQPIKHKQVSIENNLRIKSLRAHCKPGMQLQEGCSEGAREGVRTESDFYVAAVTQ